MEVGGSGVLILVGPGEHPLSDVDAVVYEEDTYLALSAEPEFRPVSEHPARVMTEAFDTRPKAPGTVVVQDERPLRLLAIIHSLDEEPTCREEWVADALMAVFGEIAKRGLRTVSLPLLGTVHGTLRLERSLSLLLQALEATKPSPLTCLSIQSGRHSPEQILSLLATGI